MSRRWIVGAAALVAVAGAAAIWIASRPAPIPTKPPATAPAVHSCWAVDPATAQAALPWPGKPVDCAAAHTAEIFYVGQVDLELIGKYVSSTGEEQKVAVTVMYAEVRRVCAVYASTYLGVNWHATRMTVLANWISPTRDGFYGCTLAQTADPGGTRLVSRTGSAKDGGTHVGIACVDKASDGTLGYSACDQPHAGEFVGTYAVTPVNARYDAAALKSTLDKGCGDLRDKYLGASRTDLALGYVGPTSAQTWLGSDQTFACYTMAQVTLRGTVRSIGTRPLPH